MPATVRLGLAAAVPTGCRKCRRWAQEPQCQKLCLWLGSVREHEPRPGRKILKNSWAEDKEGFEVGRVQWMEKGWARRA